MNPEIAKRLPAAQQQATALAQASQGVAGPPLDPACRATLEGPTQAQRMAGMVAAERGAVPGYSCEQRLYVSFFFDGTGNNLKNDRPTLEHSNVARMFDAHSDNNSATGVYKFYIPGIGTPFHDIGDKGAGPIPWVDHHAGMGGVGQGRLDWAFNKLRERVKAAEARAQNPSNKIKDIRVAVFGFSRGATLARAFVRDLFDPSKGLTVLRGGVRQWAQGGYALSVEFMGLWDTVAAVGLPMSANNLRAVRSERRGNVTRRISGGAKTPMLRAVDLAFGAPGADPSPGTADGHGAWADGLAIPEEVRACVHMIAAHEVRNSFPVDSVQRGNNRPACCKEAVYPGVHSDVGGGYRPGEGGLLGASPAGSVAAGADLQLSLIPLRAMYDEALVAGVPLRRMQTSSWTLDNASDFSIDPDLARLYNHYLAQLGNTSRPLGQVMLAHTRLYWAWRWHRIAKGRSAQLRQVGHNEAVFTKDRQALEAEVAAKQQAIATLKRERQAQFAELTMGPPPKTEAERAAHEARRQAYVQENVKTDKEIAKLERDIIELEARIASAPATGKLAAELSRFDAELLEDVRSIQADIAAHRHSRQQLRPHYRQLVETYEAEFEQGKGLRDEKVIAFFDNHVHDSLANFNTASDSTLPSDPRVIYVGQDAKLLYAESHVYPQHRVA